jgi:N-acetylmuramoyl-L-alanine amidase
MRQFIALLITLLCINASYADNRATLLDFRFATSEKRTQIIIDLDKKIKYNINTNVQKIRLNIQNVKLLSQTYDKIFYTDSRIKKTRIKRQKNTMNFVFSTAENYNVNSYLLQPDEKYQHHRLVINLNNITAQQKINQKTILIDAGHGGQDPGAIGYRHTREKHITLSIAKKLAKLINRTKGMKAVLTRRGDYFVGLTKRIKIAQANKASVFVSIHADAVQRRSARGASVYTLSERGGSTKFARQLERSQNIGQSFDSRKNLIKNDQYLNKILWNFSRKDRDIQSQKLGYKILKQMSKIGYLHKKIPQKAGFIVLKTPAIPSVLVETAFISNPLEEKRLNNTKEQDKIANAIYQGILNYYR